MPLVFISWASLSLYLSLVPAAPERSGIVAAVVMLAGLVLLVVGTNANIWASIALVTVLVGAGGGVASAAAFAIAVRSSLAAGFTSVIVALAVVTALLPLLRERNRATACPRAAAVPAT